MNEKMILQMDYINDIVCNITHLNKKELLSNSRERYLCDARRLSYALIRQLFGTPFLAMGKYFSKNHASIIHALKGHRDLLEYDDLYRDKYTRIYRLINEEMNKDIIKTIKIKLNEETNHLADDLREDS